MFGHYQLLRLLGKSARSMAWQALDTRSQQEFVLTIPRTQPRPEVAAAWMQTLRRAARLNHPHLARAVEIGEFDRWPFMAYDRSRATTWVERFSSQGLPGLPGGPGPGLRSRGGRGPP
jgi:eukaryotic-like serine/threonine-protein kinase